MDSTTHNNTYTEIQILALVKSFEKDEAAFKWLLENALELAALSDFFVYRKPTANEWLEKNHFPILSNFIKTIEDFDYYDDEAFAYLMHNNHREWAAVASIINDGDAQASIWLIKSGLKHYALLAEKIDKCLRRMRHNLSEGDMGAEFEGDLSNFHGFGGLELLW